MKVDEITTEGLRVPDRTYSLRGPSAAPLPLVLVTAPPGGGKTSLLRAIAAAKDGVAEGGSTAGFVRLCRDDAKEARLAATWRLGGEEAKQAGLAEGEHRSELRLTPTGVERTCDPGLARLFTTSSLGSGLAKMELFPAERRLCVAEWSHRQPPLSTQLEARKRLSADGDKYRVLARVLRDVQQARADHRWDEVDDAPRGAEPSGAQRSFSDPLETYQRAVEAMLPAVSLESVMLREEATGLRFRRADGRVVELDGPCTSEQQGVLLALVFAWLDLRDAIVLVDTPELGLHSACQRELLERLGALAAGSQVIAATGSDALLRDAKAVEVLDVAGGDAGILIAAAREGRATKPAGANKDDWREAAAAATEAPAMPGGTASAGAAHGAEHDEPVRPAVLGPEVEGLGRASEPTARVDPLEPGAAASLFGPVVSPPATPAAGLRQDALASPWARRAGSAEAPSNSAISGAASSQELTGDRAAAAAPSLAPAGVPLAPPQAAPQALARPVSVRETADVDIRVIASAASAVPFSGTAEPPASGLHEPRHGEAQGQASPSAHPSRSDAGTGGTDKVGATPPSKDRPAVGETQEVTLGAIMEASALPFAASGGAERPPTRKPPSASYPQLTLEQYASYCAEVAHRPQDRAAIYAKYGTASPAARTALAVAWGDRFASNPADEAHFAQLEQRYLEWLRTQRVEQGRS